MTEVQLGQYIILRRQKRLKGSKEFVDWFYAKDGEELKRMIADGTLEDGDLVMQPADVKQFHLMKGEDVAKFAIEQAKGK